jgi:hypothetical protein
VVNKNYKTRRASGSTGGVLLAVLSISLLLSALLVTPALAHDPKKLKRKPTKAAPALKEARRKMDAAKQKLAAAGNYDCCIKPSCDLCARTGGKCDCASSVAAGKGACGECLEGWQSGLGQVKGVKREQVTLRSPAARPIDEELKKIEEIVQARESMNTAKRVLVGEGRYACCVTGGCDSCAHGAECPCGTNLSAPVTPAKKDDPKPGVCGECLDEWHAGHGAYQGVPIDEVQLESMEMEMPSSFGVGSMFRQGSGTSWIPEATPMYAFMGEAGDWMFMFHPFAFSTYTYQSGPRGNREYFSTNWVMASAQSSVKGLTGAGPGTLLVRGMFSLDALTAGRDGYPLLFQTGETFKNRPLLDRQHPHDFLMEMAVAYSAPLTEKTSISAYFAPMGEPALGPAAFPHRISALDNPEAPLSHHWQDSTHIAAGVVTLGLAREKWKIEGSLFTGREPDEKRWNFEKPKFDSWSTRLSINPHPNWSGQISYGRLREPEVLEPGVETKRATASVTYQHPISDQSYLAASFIWGRNIKRGGFLVRSYGTNAFLVESTASLKDRANIFGRYERVDKDELFADGEHVHDPLIFTINRYTVGGVYNLPLPGSFDVGIGSSFSFHRMASDLKFFFGERPVSATVFLRFRPKRWGWRE